MKKIKFEVSTEVSKVSTKGINSGMHKGDRDLYAAQQKGINRKINFSVLDVCAKDFNSNFEIHIRTKSVFTRKTQVFCHNS